jgi:hypothetical protein
MRIVPRIVDVVREVVGGHCDVHTGLDSRTVSRHQAVPEACKGENGLIHY